ncbi:hypothetical protein CKAH01_12314 [Colletotrichum kahawae]|uniref:Uncharacterized protein n=1 Tax=Colletotrichum kahawae TaxID=34407 RepID=A0AAD9YTQ8_COLKA|nr:hypothetical protein CKAH01_12314 [Colletotrichum kahawae]
MHLSSMILGACLLAIGADAQAVSGRIYWGRCDKKTNTCRIINELRPELTFSVPCGSICTVHNAVCRWDTEKTWGGHRIDGLA